MKRSRVTNLRNYTHLSKLDSFDKRFEYLVLSGLVGTSTFGYNRFLNQHLYTSSEWLRARDIAIVRDNGCDLGFSGYEIGGNLVVHHMNPIHPEDIIEGNSDIFNPEFLITTSAITHRAIHFGTIRATQQLTLTTRTKYDTCPWK